MLSKEEIEFCSSLEKMFNYLKTKKELTEFEQQVIINFDYITKKVLSDECKTATEIVAKNMYYELVKRKEEYYKKQINQLESREQKLIEKLEKNNQEDIERVKYHERAYRDAKKRRDTFYMKSHKRKIDTANARREVRKSILEILKKE